MVHTGGHFLQIPGPTNVPDRVLRAMDMPTIDHRGPEFAQLGLEVLDGCKAVFRTKNPVVIYPSSGTGAWEAAIVNTLAPGDKVLMAETGHFATLWKNLAEQFKLDVDFLAGDWRRGAQPAEIEARLQILARVQRLRVMLRMSHIQRKVSLQHHDIHHSRKAYFKAKQNARSGCIVQGQRRSWNFSSPYRIGQPTMAAVR